MTGTFPTSNRPNPVAARLAPSGSLASIYASVSTAPGTPNALAFGNTAPRVAKTLMDLADNAVTPSAIEKAFDGMNRVMPKPNIGWGGFSLEDWASRMNILWAGYVPQTLMAFYENAHKWETLGRNALIFFLTIGVMAYNKSESYSINTMVFDRWMKPEKLGGNYFDALKAAGIPFKEGDLKKAYWAKLDLNQADHLEQLGHELNKALTSGAEGKADVGKLKQLLRHMAPASDEAALSQAKSLGELIPKFIKRMNNFKIGSTAIITVALAVLVGQLSMEFVWRFIAPFDKDFDRERYLAQKNSKDKNDIFKKELPPRIPARLVRIQPQASAAGFSSSINPTHAAMSPGYAAMSPGYGGPPVLYAGPVSHQGWLQPKPPGIAPHAGGPHP